GRDGLVRKIVKFPVSKTVDRELTSKERRAIDEEAKRGAAEAYKALTSGITLPASDATATDKNRADAIAKVERRAASNWIYSEQNDEMGRGTTKMASVLSFNEIEFHFPYGGSQRAKIQLQSSPDPKNGKNGKSVVFLIENGQFLSGYPTCDLAIRFDDGKIQTF